LTRPTADFIEGAIAKPLLLILVQVNRSMGYGHRAFEDIAAIVGELAAERLSIECGGRYYYLGMRINKETSQLPDLVRCLGVKLAEELINLYPDRLLFVPLYGKHRARNRTIVLLEKQYKVNDLARMFGLSARMVRYILRAARTELDDLGSLTQARAS
jgi:hypothetical protein